MVSGKKKRLLEKKIMELLDHAINYLAKFKHYNSINNNNRLRFEICTANLDGIWNKNTKNCMYEYILKCQNYYFQNSSGYTKTRLKYRTDHLHTQCVSIKYHNRFYFECIENDIFLYIYTPSKSENSDILTDNYITVVVPIVIE